MIEKGTSAAAQLARIHHVTAVNREGIAYMARKDYGSAARAFVHGLDIVKGLVSKGGSPEDYNDDQRSGISKAVNDDAHEALFSFSSTTIAIGPGSVGTYVFPNPMAVIPPQGTTPSYSLHVELSFAILYNLALAHHLRALEGDMSVGSFKVLRKAASMYNLAVAIHQNGDVRLTPLQAMAIANNMGQAYARLGCTDASTTCFTYLASLVLGANGGGDRREDEAREGFVGNVLRFLLKHHGCHAPAA
jgi:hypothetical protein